VGNGNVEVGNHTPTRKPDQPAVEPTSGRNGSSEQRIDSSPKTEAPCGAMSQQGDEFHGNLSAPQKFVHLVGCREPKVVRGSEVRQYSNATKR
jgi:hypothetical protein